MTQTPDFSSWKERAIGGIPFGLGDRIGALLTGDGLRARALRGSIWTFFGFGLGQTLRLASTLVLTRLLFPEAFGLMALVGVFMQALEMFSAVGLRGSVIHHRRGDDPDFLNTVWTVQVIRGLILWGVACLLAWPIARLYEEPALLKIMPVAGLSSVIAGFNTTKVLTANRHLAMGRLVLINLVVRVVKITILILLAWWLRSVWALVVGGLASTAFQNVMNHISLPGPFNQFRWDRSVMRDLFNFGKWVLVSTCFTFLAVQSDRILIGKFAGMEVLGVYSIAVTLMLTGKGLLDQLSATVLMPGIASKLRLSDIASSRSVIYRTRWLLGLGAACMIFAMALLGPLFFTTLYDARYHSAGWMSQFLCVGLWFSTLNGGAESILLASGNSRSVAFANAINTIATILLAPLGYWYFDIVGFILGWSAGNVAGLAVLHTFLCHGELYLWRIDVLLSVAVAMLTGLALTAQYELTAHTDWPTWLCLLAPALLVGVLIAATALHQKHTLMGLLR